MISSKNQPHNQTFQNSGGPIKLNLSWTPDDCVERTHSETRLRDMQQFLGRDDSALRTVDRLQFMNCAEVSIERELLRRAQSTILVDAQCTLSYAIVGEMSSSGQTFYDVGGLINDPAARTQTREEIIESFRQAFEEMRGGGDIILIDERGTGKSMTKALLLKALAEKAFDSPLMPVEDLSCHAGERHRQVQRQQHSKRSRAGKAERWS